MVNAYRQIEVEMNAFGGGVIRVVDIPYEEFSVAHPMRQLYSVFHWGQNDFQPRPLPSVSVGDVIRLHGIRYEVAPVGFTRVGRVEEAK